MSPIISMATNLGNNDRSSRSCLLFSLSILALVSIDRRASRKAFRCDKSIRYFVYKHTKLIAKYTITLLETNRIKLRYQLESIPLYIDLVIISGELDGDSNDDDDDEDEEE